MNLKLYSIDNEYINYLLKYDKKVPFNKNKTRPYIGIVYKYDGNNYFAPLSSPKEKHLKINDKAIDIYKIDKGVLGVINLNNMIPAPMECLTEIINTIKDKTYKKLLEKQITYINDNKKDLLKKVNQFQLRYRKGHLPKEIIERCCNFILLEEKCKKWKKRYNVRILNNN